MRRARALVSVGVIAASVAVAACGASTPEPSEASAPTGDAAGSASADPSASPASARRRAKQTEAEHLHQLIESGEFDATDIEVGTGPTAEAGMTLSVRYVGTLADGTVFDQTGRKPFEFTLGAGEVIAGWDRGMAHMKVGGKRRLVVPAELGYGARGAPPAIPPNATLVFTVELVGVEP